MMTRPLLHALTRPDTLALALEPQFFNTLSRTLEPLRLKTDGKVNMYVCGPTVYDDAHLGHARCYMTWDVLFRWLCALGYEVTYARNVTDVDDKILKRAVERGVTPQDIAETYHQRFQEDMNALHVLPPTLEPKATEHIDVMHEGIQTLIEKGFAYPTPSGSVYFRVNHWQAYCEADTHTCCHPYGHLSGKTLESLEAGARVEPDPEKEHPLDFALWKSASVQDGVYWRSPWGEAGRPGWHIECSAMNYATFADQLDIHAGGADLMFPHHENEIAQSEAWTGQRPYATLWMHNGFVNVEGEKMSKSLGNFTTVRGLLETFDANTVRYFLLQHHYRMPVDFNEQALTASRTRLSKLAQALLPEIDLNTFQVSLKELPLSFLTAMAQDMNTAQALGILNSQLKTLKHLNTHEEKIALKTSLLGCLVLLGFNVSAMATQFLGSNVTSDTRLEGTSTGCLPDGTYQWVSSDPIPSTWPEALWPSIQEALKGLPEGLISLEEQQALQDLPSLMRYRQQVRTEKRWEVADALRNVLASSNVKVIDKK
ncbi:MAG: cysteine--tRNA ligase [Vampirovibrionales bacterium]